MTTQYEMEKSHRAMQLAIAHYQSGLLTLMEFSNAVVDALPKNFNPSGTIDPASGLRYP